MARKTPPKKIRKKIPISRKTTEVKISGSFLLDGSGKVKVDTGIKFLDHMLDEFAFHGFFDLVIKAEGDLGVDIHHTNEDIGIVLGDAIKKSIGDTKGIRRFGEATVSMEDVLAQVAIDICGRGSFSSNLPDIKPKKSTYCFEDAEHFLDSLAKRSGANIKVNIIQPGDKNIHHILEATFKALGLAMDRATQIDERRKGTPSTKGIIDL